ncbi:hypothetical protein AB0442_03155 [Kitasatospora sp. NPDC085895]|uniref:hypothetical protein n=1 Tax=Kitasatospora sp. NPDC085895 TaxID=3155057 RepID=UPI00344E9783
MDEQWKAPWTYGWETPEPPPAPPVPARRRPRRAVGAAAAVLGGAALLGGMLATCGPGGPDGSGELTGVLASAAPPAAPAASVPAPPWNGRPAGPSPDGTGDTAAASPTADPSAAPSAEDVPAAAPSRTARPGPARSPLHPRPGTRPRATAVVPHPTTIKVCAEAERQGQWAPGSERARICRNLYGG